MLRRIDLRHFKCFTLLKLPLCPLTLLSGANASGKSSVLQALVLLHQTMREHEWSTRLMLNGSAVRLGTVADVIDQMHGRRSVEIALSDDGREFQWEFMGERAEMSMGVARVRSVLGDADEDEPKVLRHLLPWTHGEALEGSSWASSLQARLCGLTYLTAERVGPRETYPLEDLRYAPVVGPRGEHAAGLLYSGSDTRVLDGLIIEDVPPTLLRQVEAHMDRFFRGCELSVGKVPQANAVTLGLRTSKGMDFHRPIHTGFGLTQVLPIVVAALSATKDDLLLIENPEAHLHPSGQAAMGEFLAKVAAAGVQIILETHSDHVLNGVRRAVKRGALLPEDTALHFFRLRREEESDGAAQVQSPVLDRDGNIDTWPEGFFDQFDKDMNDFAGWT